MSTTSYWTRLLYDARKQLHELQDEIARLRAAMPCEVLREYDRRHKDGS